MGEFSGVEGIIQPPPHEPTAGEEIALTKRKARVEDEERWAKAEAELEEAAAKAEETPKPLPPVL